MRKCSSPTGRLTPSQQVLRGNIIAETVEPLDYTLALVEDLCRMLGNGGAFMKVEAALDQTTLAAAGLRVWRF